MDDPDQQKRAWKIPHSLRALRNTNYRLFISGQIISLTGSWVQSTALSWLVYNLLTHSSFYLGVLNFALQIPVLLLGLPAGALADSVNRHRLLIFTQVLMMVQSIVLTALTLIHGADGMPLITVWTALLLAVLAGTFQAFDLPARQAFLLEMVPREDLQNAVALNSLTFNTARIIGPSIAGILIAEFGGFRPNQKAFGEGVCFLLNSCTFIAVLYSLFAMKVTAPTPVVEQDSRLQHMLDGLRFVRRRPHVKALLGHLTVMALFGIPYLMIMPVYAREVLHGASTEYGSLMTAVGFRAVIGGIIMTRRASVRGLGTHMSKSVFGFIVVLVLLALNSNYYVALGLLAVAGFFMVMAMIGSQTLVQTILPSDMRGRVMSIYTMISVGFLPFGSLLSGAIAEHWGVRTTLIFNAAILTLATAYYTWRLPELRRIALSTKEYRSAMGAD